MIVIDASVVANALGDDGAAGSAARSILRIESEVAAPELMDVETVSVLRKMWLGGKLTADRFGAAVNQLSELGIARHQTLQYMNRAFRLRANLTPYDAMYVALAEDLHCALVTTDARLASAPGPTCEFRIVRT